MHPSTVSSELSILGKSSIPVTYTARGIFDLDKYRSDLISTLSSSGSAQTYGVYVIATPLSGGVGNRPWYAGLAKRTLSDRLREPDEIMKVSQIILRSSKENRSVNSIIIYQIPCPYLSTAGNHLQLRSLETTLIQDVRSVNPNSINKMNISGKTRVCSDIPVKICGVTSGKYSAPQNLGSRVDKALGREFEATMRW
jgi:hypothetical protein